VINNHLMAAPAPPALLFRVFGLEPHHRQALSAELVRTHEQRTMMLCIQPYASLWIGAQGSAILLELSANLESSLRTGQKSQLPGPTPDYSFSHRPPIAVVLARMARSGFWSPPSSHSSDCARKARAICPFARRRGLLAAAGAHVDS
jgi:hypothetical protein